MSRVGRGGLMTESVSDESFSRSSELESESEIDTATQSIKGRVNMKGRVL
jgi:hypothetical protein